MKKTLKISEETHQNLKLYCVKNNMKMNEWVEECIKEGIKMGKKYVTQMDN